ncbi:MAG: hypothetical protein HC927_00720 [Deltaproteobacteria bacterium]|nr:hypothetical protein [Deltaproteobacteria bacterium]
MTRVPHTLSLHARVDLSGAEAAFERLLDWARRLSLGPLAEFSIGGGETHKGDEAELRRYRDIANSDGVVLAWPVSRGLDFVAGSSRVGRGWELDFRIDTSDPQAESTVVRDTLETLESCVIGMLDDPCVTNAIVRREGAGTARLPRPAEIDIGSTLIVTKGSLAWFFDDVDAVLGTGWDERLERDGRILLRRAAGLIDGLEYRHKVQEQQWTLARLARPKMTMYDLGTVPDEEWPIYHTGAPRLETVGYLESEHLLELSCVLTGPNHHIQGWEICNLAEIVQRRQLPDGRPIERVRVVFLEREQAMRERRPLLDNGIEVYCLDEEAELVRIEE